MLNDSVWATSKRKGWGDCQVRKIGPLALWIEKQDNQYSVEVKTLAGSLASRKALPDGSPIQDETTAKDVAENEARAVLKAFLEELDGRALTV